MDDAQLLRYSRQIMLPALDIAGQQRLLDARVLVLGMGGLGSPVAMYLAAAGVGELLLADDDEVELSNLQRQVLHSEAELGQLKVASAARRLRGLNSDVKLREIAGRLDESAITNLLAEGVDLVVDACDNFSTRFAANRACVAAGVPLVSGAAIRMEGQVSVFDSRQAESPCYQCLYQAGDDEQASCARNGVLSPVVGVIGAVQAVEAIKLLAGIGRPLTGRLLLLDALDMQWRELRLRRDPACPVCGHRPPADG